MSQHQDSRAGGATAWIPPSVSGDTQFPRVWLSKFAGRRIDELPIWYLQKMVNDTSRPFLCVCARCVLSGEPAPSRGDIRVITLEAAKEKQKEVIA